MSHSTAQPSTAPHRTAQYAVAQQQPSGYLMIQKWMLLLQQLCWPVQKPAADSMAESACDVTNHSVQAWSALRPGLVLACCHLSCQAEPSCSFSFALCTWSTCTAGFISAPVLVLIGILVCALTAADQAHSLTQATSVLSAACALHHSVKEETRQRS